ncbi:cupin domain-containing protein [Planktotalea sp.]|uniref:cupin domain-containing protein n=1 Tax=Planktotalea sp. TaxID=2029877 RepID=UPI0025EC91E3|nr:cupin domain-containing protein [Planktotalea sp.]
MNADMIIKHLDLQPHPEGGWYRQTYIDDAQPRANGTCIYFLLRDGQASHWHKVDAAEIWHYYTGAPLVLSLSETDQGPATDYMLTPDLNQGMPQLIVPPHHWQAARTTGDFTLVGCTVSPGFNFEGFTLAAPDFDIPR